MRERLRSITGHATRVIVYQSFASIASHVDLPDLLRADLADRLLLAYRGSVIVIDAPGKISHGPAIASAAEAIASCCGLGISDPEGNATTNLISTSASTRSSFASCAVTRSSLILE